jgi:hypothetical protein
MRPASPQMIATIRADATIGIGSCGESPYSKLARSGAPATLSPGANHNAGAGQRRDAREHHPDEAMGTSAERQPDAELTSTLTHDMRRHAV